MIKGITDSHSIIKASLVACLILFEGYSLIANDFEGPSNLNVYENGDGLPSGSENFLRTKYAVLILLDKITGRRQEVTLTVDAPITFGMLTIVLRGCFQNKPEDPQENVVFLEIFSKEKGRKDKIFSGWMFSSAPSLSALEHAIYDVQVKECKNAAKNDLDNNQDML